MFARPGLRRATHLLVATLLAMLVLPAGTVVATHGNASIVEVGVDIDGDTDKEDYHVASSTITVGQSLDFFFDNGAHNVVFTTQPAGATLSDSPGAPGTDTVGSTFTVSPTVPGTYRFICSIHADPSDANTTYDSEGQPDNGKMVGRIIVQADTTPPTWGSGSAAATAISGSQIDLTWPTATDDSGTVSYEVYEATGAAQPAKPGAPATTVSGTNLSRTGLTGGTHYWYWITAVDGAANAATPDQQADDTTLSINASATTSGSVGFSVSSTLSISVTPSLLDLNAASPASAATGSATVSIESNNPWSLSVKSLGRDGIDGSPGDDAVFDDGSGATIPVSRMTWEVGGGGTTPMSDGDAIVLTGQSPTSGANVILDYSLLPLFTDPAATNFATVIQYTVTQP